MISLNAFAIRLLCCCLLSVGVQGWNSATVIAQDAPSTDSKADAAKWRFADSLVMAAVKFGDDVLGAPGVVIGRYGKDNEFALIAIKLEKKKANSNRDELNPASGTYYIRTQISPPKFVAANLLSVDRGDWAVIATAAATVPAPLEFQSDWEPKAEEALLISGYEIHRSPTELPSFAPYQGIATVVAPAANARLGQKPTFRCEIAPMISMGILATKDGVPVAITYGSSWGSSNVCAFEKFDLDRFLKPKVVRQDFGFSAGDKETVTYEMVVVLDDPLRTIESPTLKCETDPKGNRPPMPNDDGYFDDQFPDAKEYQLQWKKPSPAVLEQRPWLADYPDRSYLIASFSAPHPGVLNKYLLASQFAYVEDGQRRYLQSQVSTIESFNPRSGTAPNFPGLNGRPLDFPRIQTFSNGEIQFTSESTQVENKPSSFKLKEPERSGASLVKETLDAGDADAKVLRVPKSKIPAVFSTDGKWMYYLSQEDSVLRKIATDSLSESLTVRIQESGAAKELPCSSLAMSQAGLVVAAEKLVLVIDPNTLKFKHAVEVPVVSEVAACPTSNYGFASGRDNSQNFREPAILSIIDFASGKRLHEIKSSYPYEDGNRSVTLPNFPLQTSASPTNLVMLAEDRFYLAPSITPRKLSRYRLEKGNLIFEHDVPFSAIAIGNQQFATRFQSTAQIEVRNIDTPEKVEFTLPTAYSAAVFQPTTNQLMLQTFDPISDKEGKLEVFSPTGTLLKTVPLPGRIGPPREVELRTSPVSHPSKPEVLLQGSATVYVKFTLDK